VVDRRQGDVIEEEEDQGEGGAGGEGTAAE